VDLNIYNGEYAGGNPDPDNRNPGNLHFTSRERIGDNGDWNVWKQSFSNPEVRNQRDFCHSFGFVSGLLNTAADRGRYLADETNRFSVPSSIWPPSGNTRIVVPSVTLPPGIPTVWTSADYGAGSPYIGVPRMKAFPWLTWNDHPFISHMELMNVPASSPSRLLLEHHLRSQGAEDFYNHYVDRSPQADDHGPRSPGPPFGHLLNFYYSSDTAIDAQGGWANEPTAASNFHRVFGYLRVPSRFDGANQVLNPQPFMSTRLGVSHGFHPPYNRLSAYRDAGLININTILDDGTMWQAIFKHGNALDHWWNVFVSRQGYGTPGTFSQPLLPLLNNHSPTFFANPFRPFSEGYNVPIPALANQNADPAGPARKLVEATLLRPDPRPTTGVPPLRPLIVQGTKVDLAVNPSGFDYHGISEAQDAHNDGDRNPYFRYESLTKSGNILTTRSNVYAVWITVGYFEVSPEPTLPRSLYPDGYVLGPELGSDTGEVMRHRMFFMLDRTIPVAFQRGEDYNVEKAIVLKTIIE
jgi:hypothetical protein